MNMKSLVLAGVSMLALASVANAGQPLTNSQMDRVSAGAAATAIGTGFEIGDFDTAAIVKTFTNADVIHHMASAAVTVESGATSALFQAQSRAASAATASLP